MALIQNCIHNVIEEMNLETKGMLKLILTSENKSLAEETDSVSPEKLKEYGKDVATETIAPLLIKEFSEGFGIVDSLTMVKDGYGEQLDIVIDKIMVNGPFKCKSPLFPLPASDINGAIQRESWVVNKTIEAFYDHGIGDDTKAELVKQACDKLRKNGVTVDSTKSAELSAAILSGGLNSAKVIMGANFNRMIVAIANVISKMLFQKGLTVAANVTLQKALGLALGPIGWAATGVATVPLLSSLVNSRGYSKYLSSVIVIGLVRIDLSYDNEIYDDDIFVKNGLLALSKLKNRVPNSPNANIEMKVLDGGVFWTEMGEVNNFKLQQHKISKHYRVLNNNKKRIAYGTASDIGAYLNEALQLV